MVDLTNVEKIIENIGVNKEILSTMPQNNEKNKKIYKRFGQEGRFIVFIMKRFSI